MNERKYTFAVYSLIAAGSIILALVALNYFSPNDAPQSLLLNLSTELAGAFLIFIIVNWFFNLREENLTVDELKNFRNSLENNFSLLVDQKNLTKNFNAYKLFSSAYSVEIFGYNLHNTLKLYQEPFANIVNRGGQIKILTIDPDSKAFELIRKQSNSGYVSTSLASRALTTFENICASIENGKKGTIEFKYTSWAPSCKILIIREKDGTGKTLVDIYPPSLRGGAKFKKSLVFDSINNPNEFQYFVNQYEYLWENNSRTVVIDKDAT